MKRKTMKKCLGIVLAALIASSIGAVPVAAEEVPEANEPVAEEEVPAEAETVLESEVVETEAVLMPEGTLSPAPGSGMFAGMTPNGTITEFVDPWGTTSCFWSLAYEGTGTYESITADTVNKTITFKGLVSSSELHIFSASEGYTYIFEGTNTINAIAIEAFQANPCPNITLQCKEGSTLTTSTWYDVCDQYLTLASGTTSDPAPRVNLQAVTFTGAATQSGGDSGDSGDSSSGDSGDSSSGDSGDSSSGDSGDSSSGDDSSAGDTSDASSNDNASSDEVTSPATAEIINGVFQNALGRDADEDGLKYWTKQIEDEGKTVADLIRGVIGSAEFEAKKLSDGDYVDTLYKVCCNRASDAEGKKYWTDKLGAGTDRDAVLESFLNSQEYADVCANSNVNSGTSTPSKTPSRATLSFVERLYKKCLGRSSESDGKDYWAGNITSKKVSGSAVARGFFFSAEYTAKNRTNEEFVTDLYASIFGREADSEGYQYWLNKLKNGTSREEVFNGFANSKEWDGMCNKYGITK